MIPAGWLEPAGSVGSSSREIPGEKGGQAGPGWNERYAVAAVFQINNIMERNR